jgi:hypothetical protein
MANIEINKTKLILAEGREVQGFIEWICKKCRSTNDIQVMNFGGISELRLFIKNLVNMDRYDEVESVAVVRDAEEDADSAIDSIKSALGNNELGDDKLPVPNEPFTFQSAHGKKVAYMILSDPNDSSKGTLEDLCLAMVDKQPIFECINSFFECAQEKCEPEKILQNLPKRKVRCYLSTLAPKFIGANIGEAAERGAWDISHEFLLRFKHIIEEL